ncbi:MAG: ABC transporter permease [Bacteroidia bacterium]|nr:MAG: ABC transporter permease [Bacteroidia bacterium]
MIQIFYIARKIIHNKDSEQSISLPAIRIGTIAVGLGIAVMILSVAVIRGFKQEINIKLKRLTSDMVIMPYQESQDITSHSLSVNNDTLKLIRENQLVQYAEPVCIKNGILKVKEENEGVIFKGVLPSYHWEILKNYLVEGEFPRYSDTAISKEVIISKKLADRMQLQLNQKIIVYFVTKVKDENDNEKIDYRSRDFYIKGIIHPQMGELDNQLIFGDARIIQKINNWNKNSFSQIEIYGKNNISGDELVEQLIDYVPYNYKLVSTEELYSNIFNWLEMIDVNGVIIIVLMLMVAAVNMVSALIILILEKVSLIGILKALGMTNWNIKNIFLIISLKILGWGLLIGNSIAIVLIILQNHFHIFKLDAEAYYVDYIPIEWNLMDWFLLNTGTILTCLLCMYIPTYLISKMQPSEILRWE